MKKLELSIVALTQSPRGSSFYTLLLEHHETSKRFPINIGIAEAESIALGIEHVPIPRPSTHDLMKNIIEELGASLKEILIYKIDERNLVFYAYLYIQQGTDLIEVDCRPSDAISLAVRFGMPIYCYEEVIHKIVHYNNQPLEKKQLSLEELNQQLTDAVEKENYEEAIKIRDEIARRS